MEPKVKTELHALIEQQRASLLHFYDAIEIKDLEKTVELCLESKGAIVCTGVGKSGIVANKVASTLVSTGTKAQSFSPTDLVHGGFGAVDQGDVALLFSKSGQTKELVELVPHLRRKGVKVIAIVTEAQSPLARGADHVMELPIDQELCPFDLAPTTSAILQGLVGDLLTVALMRTKGFSITEYGENHPSGAIGRRAIKTVSELMKGGDEIPTCSLDDRLADVLFILTNKQCGCLLVVGKENELKGIFTDGDLRRALEKEGAQVIEKTMNQLLTPNPIVVSSGEKVQEALLKMQEKRYVMVAPVLEDGRVVGLLRMHDIIHEGP